MITRKKILVIGDVMLDQYNWCGVNRISPEAPIPILKYRKENFVLGGAANVANNLSANDQCVSLMGVIGGDSAAEKVSVLLREAGISSELLFEENGRFTTVKTRFVAQGQQIFRFDRETEDELLPETETKVCDAINKVVKEFDLVILSDYNKGFLTKHLTQAIIARCNAEGRPVLVDPKSVDTDKYRGCTLMKPNLREMEGFLAREASDKEITVEEMLAVKSALQCKYLLLTLGGDGMIFLDETNKISKIAAHARTVYDVTGAGDTVMAFVALNFSGDQITVEGIENANIAAGIKVSRFGTSVVTCEEVTQKKEEQIIIHNMLELKDRCIKIREKKHKIVFTNGCFDILHAGHVKYLKAARELGDTLIVGLNTDDSIRNLKGEGRPIISEADRALLLSALECVDYVVLFDEDTPIRLIETIKPDILVKGGDYTPQDIVGYDFIMKNGGRVLTIPLEQGRSTTGIIEKIRYGMGESETDG